MPEIVTYNQKTNSVFVNSFGVITLKDVQNSLAEVSALLENNTCNRLIVDVSKQEEALELVDAFTVCKDLVATLPKDLRIAYIVNDPPKQSQSFFSLMAKFLGHPVEVFFSEHSAMEWFENRYDPKLNPFYGKVVFPSISE